MRIGDLYLKNRFFLAPLAGISNLPFRLINKEFGCALVYTEMISAQGLIRGGRSTRDLLVSDEREKPVAYQIFGSDPEAMARAAVICEDYGADIVDINMGCPVKKVVRNGSGCALLGEPVLVKNILKKVRAAIRVPLTVKMRLGADSDSVTYLEIARIAREEGVDAICLHPRTKSQGFKGDIDIDALRRLKESMDITVIGSGNLFTAADVRAMFDKTRCDAVMLARGILGNPFMFSQMTGANDGKEEPCAPDKNEIRKVIMRHIDYFLEFYPENVCHKEMKKHMLWYTKGFEGSSSFRKKVVVTKDLKQMVEALEDFLNT